MVVPSLLDRLAVVAVMSFAAWTALYHLALLTPVDGPVLWWTWLALSVAGTTAALVGAGRRNDGASRARASAAAGVRTLGDHAIAVGVATGSAVLASCLVRPDLDDAAYTVRSTWIGERGLVDVGDVIFSDGAWPGLPSQTPYIASVEALAGMTAHVLGVSAGSLVYRLVVPVAAFSAVWALWSLIRAWRVRWPIVALVLAMVVVVWGGPLNASWGNLHLGRIWQGKVMLLAVLVPLAYAWLADAVRAPAEDRRRHVLRVVALGVAAVGLSPAGVFVLPGVLAVAATAAALVRRWRIGLVLFGAGAAYPLLGGVATLLAASTASSGEVSAAAALNPWSRTLGDGVPAAVVVVAAAVGLAGFAGRRIGAARSPVGRATAATAVVAGLLIALPATGDLLVLLMGTESIAWRAVWVVPVPALVGMLPGAFAGAAAERRALTAVVVGTALVAAGTPLWSSSNNAQLGRPGSWKIAPADLDVARWIVARDAGGRYLAGSEVVAAVGTITAALSPVGTRPGYVTAYEGLPGTQADERWALQMWAEGAAGDPELALVPQALERLDVRVVCGPVEMATLLTGWVVAHQGVVDTCWTRD